MLPCSGILSGGLFDIGEQWPGEAKPESVFRHCVEAVNRYCAAPRCSVAVTRRGVLANSTLSVQSERVPATDTFHTAKRGEQNWGRERRF